LVKYRIKLGTISIRLGSAPASGAVRRASRRTLHGACSRTKRFVSRRRL